MSSTILELYDSLKTALTTITGVGDWFTIEFSMLPSDDPKGFLYPSNIEVNRTTLKSTWIFAIKVSEGDIATLNTVAFNLLDTLALAGSSPLTCIGVNGTFTIDSLDIELPKSFTQENIRSNVTAYQTVVAGLINLEVGVS